MSVKVEKLEKNFVGMEIEVPEEEVAKAYQQAAKKLGQQGGSSRFQKRQSADTCLGEKHRGGKHYGRGC